MPEVEVEVEVEEEEEKDLKQVENLLKEINFKLTWKEEGGPYSRVVVLILWSVLKNRALFSESCLGNREKL